MNDNSKAIVPVRPEPEEIKLPTSSKRVVVLGLVIVVLFFGGLGGWIATATLQGAVIAPGEIIVETYRKQVQHLDGGIVAEILVREGNRVKKGQVLIRMDGERVLATRDLYQGQMWALQARQARLSAEKDKKGKIVWPEELVEKSEMPEAAEFLDSEQEIFDSRLAAKASQETIYQALITQLQSQIQGQERQLESIRRNIASLEEEISVKTPLLKEQFLDRSQIMELDRSLNSFRARKEELETQIEHAKDGIHELRLKIRDLEIQYVKEAATQLGETNQAILDLRERLRPAEEACRRLEITAPESGVVVNLNVRTEGGVIRGGEPLMEIVPQDSGLIVSAMVARDKIDDVEMGQKASVSLSAFPTRYIPKVDGVVTYVSADLVESKHPNMPPYFLVYVRLDEKSLSDAIEDATRLTPGMPAEVYIQTDPRTILSYLLTPITESMDRSFRD